MKIFGIITVILTLNLGCKKPSSTPSETAFTIPLKIEKTKASVVFIAGYDEGNNTYYTHAKNYFLGKHMQMVDTLSSLDEIIDWINFSGNTNVDCNANTEKDGAAHTGSQTEFDEIHIVSHSNAWSGMSLKTTKTGERITLKTLRAAKKANAISAVRNGITGDTKIIIHSCGLGENHTLLQEVKTAFTAASAPSVYATTFFNVFGGKFAPHYLAKPYYGFYPTAESPGPMQLAKEFKAAYPETKIDWFTALKTRREASLGEAYTYSFNIPVDWEFTFEKTADIPNFENRDALMDWISESPEMAELLLELTVPLEKYRWRSEIQGKKLLIKGKTTVLCVLAPLLQGRDMNEYRIPAIEDLELYQIL